jgi:hypothetical protein
LSLIFTSGILFSFSYSISSSFLHFIFLFLGGGDLIFSYFSFLGRSP